MPASWEAHLPKGMKRSRVGAGGLLHYPLLRDPTSQFTLERSSDSQLSAHVDRLFAEARDEEAAANHPQAWVDSCFLVMVCLQRMFLKQSTLVFSVADIDALAFAQGWPPSRRMDAEAMRKAYALWGQSVDELLLKCEHASKTSSRVGRADILLVPHSLYPHAADRSKILVSRATQVRGLVRTLLSGPP